MNEGLRCRSTRLVGTLRASQWRRRASREFHPHVTTCRGQHNYSHHRGWLRHVGRPTIRVSNHGGTVRISHLPRCTPGEGNANVAADHAVADRLTVRELSSPARRSDSARDVGRVRGSKKILRVAHASTRPLIISAATQRPRVPSRREGPPPRRVTTRRLRSKLWRPAVWPPTQY